MPPVDPPVASDPPIGTTPFETPLPTPSAIPPASPVGDPGILNNPKSKTPPGDIFTLNVGGQAVTASRDEVINLATKSAGADAKYREAAEMRKQAQDGIRMQELINGLKTTEDTSKASVMLMELYSLMGVDPEEMAQQLDGDPRMGTQNPQNTPNKQTPANPSLPDSSRKPIGMEDLNEDISRKLEFAGKQENDTILNNMRDQTKIALDKDEILGKLLSSVPEKEMAGIKKELSNMAIEEVERQVLLGMPFGPELIRNSLMRLRSRVKSIGIPSKGSGLPTSQPGQLGISGLMQNVPNEPVDRVPSTKANYADNVVTRVVQQLRGIRK